MGSVTRKVVGVLDDLPDVRHSPLLGTLAELYPIEFRHARSGRYSDVDAVLIFNGDVKAGITAAAEGVPTYVVARQRYNQKITANAKVEFGNSRELDICLRGQSMTDREECSPGILVVQPGDEVHAKRDGYPIWISRPTARSLCQLVTVSPPALARGELLFRHLNARRFLGLLPLLNFLRRLGADIGWKAPLPRACFIFDDPSLYRPSYGFLNYRLLSEHARKHDYFVSIATVPLDSWLVSDEAAETFRACSPRLSLVINGNNHLPGELLRPDNGGSHLAAAAQALRRMERLKHAHGVPFFKIMEAPHGALAEGVFEVLLSLGYEAALCTPELLVLHNPNTRWSATVGLEQSAILGGGLPVIPRIKMSPDWKNDVLLKAFLQQPIIIAGHHTDAAAGLELLSELSKVIRGLEGVTWSDLQGVLRANYLQKIEGNTLRLRMYSRRVSVPIPRGIKNLSVERPWLGPNCTEKLIISTGTLTRHCYDAGQKVDGLPLSAEVAEVISKLNNEIPFRTVAPPRLSPWSISRKLLMEVRDRLSPALPIVNRYRYLTVAINNLICFPEN